MAKNYESLAQHFEPSEGYVGCFGWLCGYSADGAFLNSALERFTGSTEAQRAYAGEVSLIAMLDEGNRQISSIEAPGLLHLALKASSSRFKLMHAKVALLAFQKKHSDEKPGKGASKTGDWSLRLLVSTGNWTRQTLEASLDLIWRIDLSADETGNGSDQIRRDLLAAWDFLSWLRTDYDERVLGLPRVQAAISQFNTMISLIGDPGAATPRLFDNRTTSLLSQLPGLIKARKSRYLAMGSCFYEGPSAAGAVPTVLNNIVSKLQSTEKLYRSAKVRLVVNPNECQGVAGAEEAIQKRGWTICQPGTTAKINPDGKTMHAKFLVGTQRAEEACGDTWVYLGSGNLTQQGFAQPASERRGNLECGVVFSATNLSWKRSPKSKSLLTDFLPIAGRDCASAGMELAAGGEMPDREAEFFAAPVAYFIWEPSDGPNGGSGLRIPGATGQNFEVQTVTGERLDFAGDWISWPFEQPREVAVVWMDGARSASVPVVDPHGRLAGAFLPKLTLADAWYQLDVFPLPPEDEVLREEAHMNGVTSMGPFNLPRNESAYVVRQMMQLVENIASRQTEISQRNWQSWCRSLEQSLTQAAETPAVAEFRKLSLNPLSPLRCEPFRPSFAEDDHSEGGQIYADVLNRLEAAWLVKDLEAIDAKS